MSDMSQGPGWWIASDGKWYPPHLHPSVRVPEPWETATEDPEPSGTPTQDPGAWETPVPSTSEAPTRTDHLVGTAGDGTSFENPARRRRRAPVAIAVGVVALLLVAVAVVVFGGSESASAQVVNAADATLGAGTAQTSVTYAVTTGGVTLKGTGSGTVDFTDNAASLEINLPEATQEGPVKAIFVGGVIYLSLPQLAQLTPGKSWLSIDLSALQQIAGQSPSAESIGDNPAGMLQVLAQQGNTVTALGPSTVDGVAVNGYGVKMNIAAMIQRIKQADLPSWMTQVVSQLKQGDARLTVFVDGAGRLQSMDVDITESAASAGRVSVAETEEFSDYGAPASVVAPPADQVQSFQQFLQTVGSQLPSAAGS